MPPREMLNVLSGRAVIILPGSWLATLPLMHVGFRDIYDPSTDKWRKLAPMPTPRSSGAAAYYHGYILYYGGECSDGEARIAYAQVAAVVGDTAYFIGGSSSCGRDKPSLPVYAFRLP